MAWEVRPLIKGYTDAFFFVSQKPLNRNKVPNPSAEAVHGALLCSKSQVPITSRQCICVGLSWSLSAIFHPGCHLTNCITQVLIPCHPKSEVTSKSCCERADVRSVLCDNSARQIPVSQVTALHLHPSYTALLPPQLFKEVFRQRSKCSEAFLKEYLQAYSYASTGTYS